MTAFQQGKASWSGCGFKKWIKTNTATRCSRDQSSRNWGVCTALFTLLRKADVPVTQQVPHHGLLQGAVLRGHESQIWGIKTKALEWHPAHRDKYNLIKLSSEEWIFCDTLSSGLLEKKYGSREEGEVFLRKNFKHTFYSVTDPSCAAGLTIKLNRTALARLSYYCKIQEKVSSDKFLFQIEIFG